MTTLASASRAHPSGRAWLARCVVVTLGGRYSGELGIDADAGDAEAERWFLAAPGAELPLDARAESAAWHLGLTAPDFPDLPGLTRLASDAQTDPRDLESGLVRLALAHHRRGMPRCPGVDLCAVLTS